jgi:uncharacterized protein YjbI with pentapeptide repeats
VEPAADSRRRFRFSIREALFAMLLVALFFGWRASQQQTSRQIANLQRRLRYAETSNTWSEFRSRIDMDSAPAASKRGVLAHLNLDGANLRSVSIAGQNSAFARASFNNADLTKASLGGAGGAFQGAKFDGARLVNAKLTGGVSAFQGSSFAGADLTGAVLTGGASSFQGSTFADARLAGAQLLCSGASFQLVNIDAADFAGADVSALAAEALKSCYFNQPPTYDGHTRFPRGFDPEDQGWKRAAERPGK